MAINVFKKGRMYSRTVFFKEQVLSKAALATGLVIGHLVSPCAMRCALCWDAKAVLQPRSPGITGRLRLRVSCSQGWLEMHAPRCVSHHFSLS